MSTITIFQTVAALVLKENFNYGKTKLGNLFDLAPSTLGSRMDTAKKRSNDFTNLREYLLAQPEVTGLKSELPVPGDIIQDTKGKSWVVLSQKPLKGVRTDDLKMGTIDYVIKTGVNLVTKPKTPGAAVVITATYDSKFRQRVVKIMAEQLGLAEPDIKDTSKLYEDLGGDSLDAVELVMALEDEFETEIPDEEAEAMTHKTVGEILSTMWAKLNGVDVKTAKPLPQPSLKEPKLQPSPAKTVPATAGGDKLVPIQAIMTPKTLIVVRDGAPLNIEKTHKNFSKIESLLKTVKDGQILQSDLNTMYNLIDMKGGLKNWSNGRVKVENNALYLDNKKIDGRISRRMVDAMVEGDETLLDKLGKFLIKLDANPAFAVVTRLYDFMQARDIQIDDDGDLICWKVVRSTYMDKHSNTMDNSPGKEVRVKRNEVDENADKTCSNGLHVCSREYIKSFYGTGDRIVTCKVSPADWVAIPRDYNNSKSRVCGYTVLADVTDEIIKKGWAK